MAGKGRSSLVALALVAGSLSAVPVLASDGEKSAGDPNRRVCRTIMPTGSRMTTRSCRTQAEWDRAQRKAQDAQYERQVQDSQMDDPNGMFRAPSGPGGR